MCRTAAAKPHHVRKAKRMANPLHKCLAPIRWMGCKVAVYDLVVRAKAEGRGESSRARRGTKRRWGRSGSRSARKRRGLATADPDSLPSPPTQSARERYLNARCEAYFSRVVEKIVKLDGYYVRARSLPKKSTLKQGRRKMLKSLVDFVSRRSGSPPWVAYLRTIAAINHRSPVIRFVPSIFLRPARTKRGTRGRLNLRPEEVLEDLRDFQYYRYGSVWDQPPLR